MWAEFKEWIIGVISLLVTIVMIHFRSVRRSARNEGRITTLEHDMQELKEEMDELKKISKESLDELKLLVKEYSESNTRAHNKLFENDSEIKTDLSEIKGYIKGMVKDNMS